MGLLKGLLGARKLLFAVLVPILLLPLPVLRPSSVSTPAPPGASGEVAGGKRGAQDRVQLALLSVSRSGNAFLEEAHMLSAPKLPFSTPRPPNPTAPKREGDKKAGGSVVGVAGLWARWTPMRTPWTAVFARSQHVTMAWESDWTCRKTSP